ncbi:MAG: IS200/IS605 family element transposase accessory protein TnpB [Nitrososphaeria archaeon]|nr:IS200/IS605 family element transposase accessory protein TnpB [Nitrososphaeria archaeon]
MLNETCRFKLSPNGEQKRVLNELFSSYENIVRECLNKAIVMNVTSRKRLHEAIYGWLRTKYPTYPSHYIYTAITQALGIFKSYRRLSRKRSIKLPDIAKLDVILLDDTHLFWFNWGNIKLATHKGHIIIPFKVHEHSKKFMGWHVKGSRLLRRNGGYFLHVTFRKAVEEKRAEGVLGIDVNEKSIDLAIIKPNKVKFIKIDISEAKYIRDRYFRKRRAIQSKTSGKTKTRLLAKYSGREQRRINNILHRTSKIIANIVAEENVKPTIENLKYIRERMKYGRKMDRRLHSMPFRKVQSYITYKAIEQGLKPEFVKAKNTSRICPTCGEVNKPNGHVFRCKKCGFQANRHLVAAWNIAMKLPMWGASPLPPKAAHEAFKAEAERIVIKS